MGLRMLVVSIALVALAACERKGPPARTFVDTALTGPTEEEPTPGAGTGATATGTGATATGTGTATGAARSGDDAGGTTQAGTSTDTGVETP